MIRDFSEKAKQKLEGYADDAAASSTWGKIKDWFSDRGMDFQSWTGKLGIENYINDVDTYHQKIIDKNNATKKKIDTIFSNVQSVDTKSMAAMNRQITCGNNIIKLINDLAASISPDGGNLDMAGMKGTLDADAARIKNPESAKNEKTEKEKLGAGDTSCKKSSDPVNLSTGNFIYDHEDMQAGGEIPLSFHRYYNSKDTGTGTMGSCFLHNYEMEVQKQPDQKAAVRMHDGQFYYFAETDTGYVAENAAMGLLERTEDGYKLTCHPGMDAVYFYENGKAARQENTNKRGITFIHDERGRLAKAETDTGSFLEYAYDSEGMLMEVTDHAGRKVKLEYDGGMLKTVTTPSGAVYTYSYGDNGRITETVNARNVTAVRNRYDSLFRVTHQEFPDGGTMDFEYDDKNSRVTLTERNGSRITYVHDSRYRNTATLYEDGTREKYLYNDRNQCICRTDRNGHTVRMSYDSRGNLLSVTSGEEVLKAYGFDAANQMSSSMGRTDGTIQKAVYQYNGLGHRMGQSIATGDAAPARTIRYTLDLTRQYHNLLQKTGNGPDQTYFWDGNVAGMEEEGRDHFYFQDDLGSPMRLTDETGRSEEAYGFDEFGNNIRTAKDIFQDSMQSFGFTGYQMDGAGGLYFAQARRYDAGAGRFVSEDILKGHIAVPYTMNHYNYCWNRPMDLVDLNGKFPSWRDLKKFWNKYIYGEETIGSSTNTVVTGKNWGMGTYHSEVYDITKTSDKYTGSWIKNVTTLGNDGNSQSYSLNIPSADLGKGNKFGIPTSLGVTFSNGGVSLDANIGIDLGKLNVNIPISIGLNWDNLVSVDASLNGGWADNSYGLDLSAGLHPGSNVKLGVHEKHAVDEKTTIKTENGVYMRMGYVYVVVIAAAALGSMLYGNDPSSAGQTIINFINNFVNNGVCPALQ